MNLMAFGLATVQQDNGAALLSRFQCKGNEWMSAERVMVFSQYVD